MQRGCSTENHVCEGIFQTLMGLLRMDVWKVSVGQPKAFLRVRSAPVSRSRHWDAGKRERRTKRGGSGGKQGNRKESAIRTGHCESPSRWSGKPGSLCLPLSEEVDLSAAAIQRDDQIVLIGDFDRTAQAFAVHRRRLVRTGPSV
jgi:hypothetical protein